MAVLSMKIVLLILFSVLSNSGLAEVYTLDMAPYVVDDTFLMCRDEMIQTVTKPDGLLQKELKASKEFAEMWRSHGGTCEKQILGGTSFHLAILQAYGNSKPKFRKMFNQMVYTKGGNSSSYNIAFPFKSLHFLLTDAIQLLKTDKTCHRVYYGTVNTFNGKMGKEIRLGKFFQAKSQESSEIETVELEGKGTVFNISSCSVVNIENYTCTSEEIEHLISPTEVFRVQNIRNVTNDDATYQIITLTHSRFLSNHDCYLFSRSSASLLSSKLLVLMMSVLPKLILSLRTEN